jgi:hypothetical protein
MVLAIAKTPEFTDGFKVYAAESAGGVKAMDEVMCSRTHMA